MKRALESLTEAEFNSLKASGLLWELYPDAPDTWVANMEDLKVKHTPTILDFEAGLDSYEQAKEALKRWECHEELLEALKVLLRRYDFQKDDQSQAEQALAKAEGRA